MSLHQKTCAHVHCGAAFESTNKTKKYCDDRCKSNAKKYRALRRNPERFRKQNARCYQNRREAYLENDRRYYREVTAPKGYRLAHRLENIFIDQAMEDPSGLPQLAQRILDWRPKGFMAAKNVATHMYSDLEKHWLWYCELTPEEAVGVYQSSSKEL